MSDPVLILGFGISGRAAAKLAISQGRKAIAVDQKDSEALRAAAAELPEGMLETRFGWNGEPLPKCSLAVLSPGLPKDASMIKASVAAGAHAISELEFGFRALPCPALAITGTNGKTTTTELTNHLLNALGVKSEAAGNIGEGLSEAAIGASERGLKAMAVEVSSFQLEGVEDFSPAAAAVLNIASDHINRHGDMDDYARTKFRIFGKMPEKPGTKIVNADVLGYWRKIMPSSASKPTTFSASMPADFDLKDGVVRFLGEGVFKMSESQLLGAHNAENVMASLALLRAFLGDGVLRRPETAEALRSFRPGAYRIELFAESGGLRFIDDSKGTNPHAVVAALKTVGGDRNVSLILGGLDKGMDFSPLAESARHVKRAFAIGQCRGKILDCVKGAFPAKPCGSLEEAVEEACEGAKPGEIVMLSPACASMDMFKDYKDRGDRFKKAVRDWLAKRVPKS